jgi:hypothetical protein
LSLLPNLRLDGPVAIGRGTATPSRSSITATAIAPIGSLRSVCDDRVAPRTPSRSLHRKLAQPGHVPGAAGVRRRLAAGRGAETAPSTPRAARTDTPRDAPTTTDSMTTRPWTPSPARSLLVPRPSGCGRCSRRSRGAARGDRARLLRRAQPHRHRGQLELPAGTVKGHMRLGLSKLRDELNRTEAA